ncbi:hypothetical protein GOP47_0029714 [Adiantum capillus-veneris]|nr:hypothetical protein GOP47_0029428 [Adiantum capillus-veneris]KAI5056193.1 hypothetical protein GOP47_0029714 [Adiantum capillus-veneris]
MAGLSPAACRLPLITIANPSSRRGGSHLVIRAGENTRGDNSGDASPRSASMATNDESPNFVLRAAWYGAEALGNISALFNPKPSTDVYDSSDVFQGPLGRDYVIQSIIDDYDKGYFVTGNVSSGVYEEDCEFADPAGSFKSLKRFKNNCSNFGSLLEKSDVKLVKSEELLDKFVAYWRFSCILKFPWRPILSSTGFTEYYFNAETGRITRHVENWDVPKMALLGQVFKPNPALKRR